MSTTPYPPRRDETATDDLTRSRHSGTSIGASAPDLPFRERAGTSLSIGAILLRQSRLRAAALGLSVWWALILVQVLLVGRTWGVPAAVVLTLGAASVLLSRRGPISPALSPALEFAIFALIAAALAYFQWHSLSDAIARDDAAMFQITLKNALIASLTLMFAYAALIPNSWRSAVPVVFGLAAYPAVTVWVLSRLHPEVLQFLNQEGMDQLRGLNLSMTVVAAGLSLYAIHILDTLRAEVFEARRLNQYQLGQLIGAGGMGEVYFAEHRLLKRTSAIKLIDPRSEHDPVAMERFELEVRATARLSHPNIIEIYDYGRTDDGTFFYVMEYLEGLSLRDLVVFHGPLSAGRVIYLMTQVCEGLAEAHAAGLIHRDLKPANLFATHIGRRYDVAKILDFGLVKDTTLGSGGRALEEEVVGTLAFMAPEQRSGEPGLDHRADLFAVGAVVYYLLTARLPYTDENGLRPLVAPGRDWPVPPSMHCSEVPADLERVVLRCLAEDPADRYPDAESLRKALAACAAASEWDVQEAMEWWRGSRHDRRGNSPQVASSARLCSVPSDTGSVGSSFGASAGYRTFRGRLS
jgi:serine/threonine-protein kinase